MNKIVRGSANKLLICHFILCSLSSQALGTETKEDTIKAIYSYKFGKFTEWPTSKLKLNSMGFCILGKNPFGQSALDAIEGKPIKGKTLHIKFFASGLLSSNTLPECHILFVSQSEKHRLQTIIGALHYQPILTVSDIEGFSGNGGMVTLIKRENQVRFEINPDNVKKAGLLMSSKLLGLAVIRHNVLELSP